jgi:hypothetical protein
VLVGEGEGEGEGEAPSTLGGVSGSDGESSSPPHEATESANTNDTEILNLRIPTLAVRDAQMNEFD